MTSEVSDGYEWRMAYATARRNRNGAPIGGYTQADEEGKPLTLNKAFLQWLRNTSTDKLAIRVSKSDSVDFISKKSVRAADTRTAFSLKKGPTGAVLGTIRLPLVKRGAACCNTEVACCNTEVACCNTEAACYNTEGARYTLRT